MCFTLLWEFRTVDQTCNYKEAHASPAMESLDFFSLAFCSVYFLIGSYVEGRVLNIVLFSEVFTSMVYVTLCFHAL